MKKIKLNQTIVRGHQQLYPDSCVPMSVEFVVKLVDPTQLQYYDQQHQYPNGTIGGQHYNNQILNNIQFTHLYPQSSHPRGQNFPLPELFRIMKYEIDHNRFVQLGLKSGVIIDLNGVVTGTLYHGWVVYGYDNQGEFLGVTRYHHHNNPIFSQTIRQDITTLQGTDILIWDFVPRFHFLKSIWKYLPYSVKKVLSHRVN